MRADTILFQKKGNCLYDTATSAPNTSWRTTSSSANKLPGFRGHGTARRRNGRRYHLELGPFLPALRRPPGKSFRGMDIANRDGNANLAGKGRVSRHLQHLPESGPALRYGENHVTECIIAVFSSGTSYSSITSKSSSDKSGRFGSIDLSAFLIFKF